MESSPTSTVDLPTGKHYRYRRLRLSAEVGTLLGRNTTGEYLVVIESDVDGCWVGFANIRDVSAVFEREPRSVAEYRLIRQQVGLAASARRHAELIAEAKRGRR